MKALVVFLLVLCSWSFSLADEEKMVFYLNPQDIPYLYTVSFRYDGEVYWYLLGQIDDEKPPPKEGQGNSLNVYYDSISKNFYTMHNGMVTIIPINRPYELVFHKKEKKGK